jgi:hypothetical protein
MDRKEFGPGFLRKVRGYPLHLLCLKGLQRSSNSIRKRRILKRRGLLSDDEFRRALRWQEISSESLCSRGHPRFFFSVNDKEAIQESWISLFEPKTDGVIQKAEEIRGHNVEILGHGKHFLGDRIDWHRDYISGEKWERAYYQDLDILDLDNPTDVRTTWEINRFHHLIHLGKAFFLTGTETYLEEFTDQLEDWIDSNPPGIGINWTCSMEVAIRAINWIWAFYFFAPSSQLTSSFVQKFLKSLLHHGRHIYRNLEFGKKNGNHLIANGLGLLYLGTLFPVFKESRRWVKKGKNILWRELSGQICDDGVHFEGAIGYHGLVNQKHDFFHRSLSEA